MILEKIQKKALKKIIDLTLNASDESLLKAISIGEKLVYLPDIKSKAEVIKQAFQEKHPSIELAKNTFASISSNYREKIIENFFINSVILGNQKRNKLEEKLGFSLPWFFVISPTARCNLKCEGCYAHEYPKNEGLSFGEVDRILNEAKELGTYFVTVSGGEPFIWPHLLDIFEKHNDMYFQIYTNGSLINKETAKRLSELGNATPAISIEGFEKETDQRRGKGVFNKIMQAMDNLKEEGVLFGFSATTTKYNLETLMSDEFIDKMISKGCTLGWYFQYVPIGKKPDVNLMATPEQRNTLRERVNEIRSTKPIFIGDFWNDGPYVRGCIAGARSGGYFHINSKGDVEPCVFLHFSVDNIKGKKLLDVIQSSFFKEIQKKQVECKNPLTPCALIDNPGVLREVVSNHNAKPSYDGAGDVITDPKVTEHLDRYSSEYKRIANPVWEQLKNDFRYWRDKE